VATAPGTYDVTVSNASGCTASANHPVTLDNVTPPSISGPSTICPGGTASLDAGPGYSSYSWTDGSNLVGTAQIFVATAPGTYDVTVSNASGCTASASVTITPGTCGTVQLNMKMFMEGYYQQGDGGGFMNNNFGAGGLLYILGASPNPNDVDTVRISAMSATPPYGLVDSQTGIVHLDGSVTVTFGPSVTPGTSYFIRVNHRNTVETWSSAPVPFSPVTTYDFTTAQSQAYGNNMVETYDHMGWAFFSGDISDALTGMLGVQDGTIESQDYSDMENAVGIILLGYVPEDITGDATVESFDYSIMENNITVIVTSMHP
jgi:hypothetical protein